MIKRYNEYKFKELILLQQKLENGIIEVEDLEEEKIDKIINLYKIQIEGKLSELKEYRNIINKY
ncbi:MAG: hypothetical protein HFJ46_07885 [Clostridia bacterium]|nr:hypothetical protein [Clostridia bacterium]